MLRDGPLSGKADIKLELAKEAVNDPKQTFIAKSAI
jgi:hypothetical protein